MTGEDLETFHDCDCGMGAKCLYIQRKQEALKMIESEYKAAPKIELSFLKTYTAPVGRSARYKMSSWSNIADLTRHRETIKVSSPGLETSFSVVSYNILADCHMEPDWYQYTPDTKRTSLQRHEALMAELEILNGDILCLQEVGVDYFPFLSTELKQRGYVGDFLAKTMGTMEGAATFYKKSQFEVVQVETFSFNDMLAEECEKQGVDVKDVKCERPHVFLVTKLRHLSSGKLVTVGNIHTIWDNFSQLDVTTLQVALSLSRLSSIAQDKTFIMAGDFNSRPKMAPYYFLLNGHLSPQLVTQLSSLPTVLHNDKSLYQLLAHCYQHQHPELTSSYLSVKGCEPELTNYDDYDGCHPADWTLDYIWFTGDTLRADMVLDTMGTPESRIPNNLYPSDHLSLKSTFTFV